MAVKIGSNIASFTAQRRLGEVTSTLRRTYERLSSGQRINSASDDAAGLAISSALGANAKIYGQAIRNLNDGISMANIAEGALSTLRDISHRQLELSEQSANGTYSLMQRQAMNVETNKLVEEYNRIIQAAEFNGQRLFSDDSQGLRIQAGNGVDGSLVMGLGQEVSRNVGNGSFLAQTNYPTAAYASSSIAAADVNGDGHVDLMSTDQWAGGHNVSLLLGRGDGTFQAAASFRIDGGWEPFMSVGDFNGDGKLDLVTTDRMVNTASVFIGNGDGTFQAATRYATLSGPSSISVGDVNGDGRLDLVTANYSNRSISVLLGNGNGAFQAAVKYTTWGTAPLSTAIGDVNGDGKADLVSADSGGNCVSIFLGNGNGTFQAAVKYTTAGNSPHWVSVGDLNGDGKLDIVTADYASKGLSVLIGNGNGTFQTATKYTTAGNNPYAVSAGDLNGDGRLDLVSVDRAGGNASVFIGRGDGTFQAATRYTLGMFASPVAIAIQDFNEDERLDLAVGLSNDSAFGVLLASGNRTATTPYLNICTRQGAYDAMAVINSNLERIQNELGSLGAVTSRFSVALNTLSTVRENSIAASSRITDADMGQEAANLTRGQIIQQAASSVLAQANLQPQIALMLLRS